MTPGRTTIADRSRPNKTLCTHLVEEALCRYLPHDATALLAPLLVHVLTTWLNVPKHAAVRRALSENTHVGSCVMISAWLHRGEKTRATSFYHGGEGSRDFCFRQRTARHYCYYCSAGYCVPYYRLLLFVPQVTLAVLELEVIVLQVVVLQATGASGYCATRYTTTVQTTALQGNEL